jgi:nucleoside-diphosphate-sugar epimerase
MRVRRAGVRIYGAGKLYQEHLAAHYAERYGLVTGGLRPSVVYGWGRLRGASVWASALVDRSVEGEPVSVRMADARVSLVYVEDVVAQFVALLTCPADVLARRRFYNTGGDTCTVRELAEAVRHLTCGCSACPTSRTSSVPIRSPTWDRPISRRAHDGSRRKCVASCSTDGGDPRVRAPRGQGPPSPHTAGPSWMAAASLPGTRWPSPA